VAGIDDAGHATSGEALEIPSQTGDGGIGFVATGLADALAQLGVDLRKTQGNVLNIGEIFSLQSPVLGGWGSWYGATLTGQAVVVPSTAAPPALFSLQFTITVQPSGSGSAVQVNAYRDFGVVHHTEQGDYSGDCS
jgi:hypothetical protein